MYETEAMLRVQEKDVSHTAKKAFYLEYLEINLDRERKMYLGAQEKSKGKDIDVLLSMPPTMIETINETVDRTQFFKNHQEFIKLAIMYLVFSTGVYNTNTMLTMSFLSDPDDLKKLKEELENLRKNI